jgi:hypothetical protein
MREQPLTYGFNLSNDILYSLQCPARIQSILLLRVYAIVLVAE